MIAITLLAEECCVRMGQEMAVWEVETVNVRCSAAPSRIVDDGWRATRYAREDIPCGRDQRLSLYVLLSGKRSHEGQVKQGIVVVCM